MQIQNQDATQIIRDQAKLVQIQQPPSNLLPNIQPVMDMTPHFHRKINWNKKLAATTSSASTSTDTVKTLNITGCTLAFAKDSTCDVAVGEVVITCVVDTVTTTLLALPVLPTIADSGSISITFPQPVVPDKNSTVQILRPATTVGSMRIYGTVFGYETQ